jgi:hypothetical protein
VLFWVGATRTRPRFTIVRSAAQYRGVYTTTKEASFVIGAKLRCSQSSSAECAIKRPTTRFDTACAQDATSATVHSASQDDYPQKWLAGWRRPRRLRSAAIPRRGSQSPPQRPRPTPRPVPSGYRILHRTGYAPARHLSFFVVASALGK